MKPGVDYVGVTVNFFCHDGKGTYCSIKEATKVGTNMGVGILGEESSSLERAGKRQSDEK